MNFELEAPIQQPTGEMTEMNLLVVARIFWPHGAWESQKRFYYDPDNRRKFYKVDCCSDTMKIIWEYEGPDHYEDVWKLKRDSERQSFFEDAGYQFLRWPYYLQLTKDVAVHFFGDAYSEKKYQEAIETVYGVTDYNFVLAPGLHTSKNTPANYVPRGVRRFFEELGSLPTSVTAQVAESLRRYIADVDDKYLVIGEQPEFEDLLTAIDQEASGCVFYSRPPAITSSSLLAPK